MAARRPLVEFDTNGLPPKGAILRGRQIPAWIVVDITLVLLWNANSARKPLK